MEEYSICTVPVPLSVESSIISRTVYRAARIIAVLILQSSDYDFESDIIHRDCNARDFFYYPWRIVNASEEENGSKK